MITSDQPATATLAALDAPPFGAPSRPAKKLLGRKRKPQKSRVTKTSLRNKHAGTRKRGSKKAKILVLLIRPGGASLQQLEKATGWQAHSVRGFLSGALKKTMGLQIQSVRQPDGTRSYVLNVK